MPGGGHPRLGCIGVTGTRRHDRHGYLWWRLVGWCAPGVGYPCPPVVVVVGTWVISLMVRFILNIQLVTAAQALALVTVRDPG